MTDEIITPDQIVNELRAVRAVADKGSDAIYLAERNYDEALLIWQEAWDSAYTVAQGTLAEREIAARASTLDAKKELDIAKAELNRIKNKIRQLDAAQSNLQTQWKAIAITYAEAGR